MEMKDKEAIPPTNILQASASTAGFFAARDCQTRMNRL
jgi:hypothetical protein